METIVKFGMMFGMIFVIIYMLGWTVMLVTMAMGMIKAKPDDKLFGWLMIVSLLSTMAIVAIDITIKW